jgi:Family of unknown function (DUF6544)
VDMRRKFLREIATAGLRSSGAPGPVVCESDVAPLPAAAQRYLRFMGVLGRPRDTSFRLRFRGRFRPGAKQGWLPCEGWQYDSQPDVARIFHMRLRMFGVPVYGRDTYLGGRGRMLIRPLDLFTVEDGRGPEYDVGELVTYLNDCALLAPSMLLVPETTFSAVDEESFELAFTNGGTTVKARVWLDEHGAPRDFETTDRFTNDPFDPRRGLVRARWTTPVEGYQQVDGRALPARGRAVWHLPQGELTYAEFHFQPEDVAFNVPPGA